jgi:hypothetical protein
METGTETQRERAIEQYEMTRKVVFRERGCLVWFGGMKGSSIVRGCGLDIYL